MHRTELAWGHATVCFPVAEPDRCTAALVVEVDPDVVLCRLDPSGSPEGFTLGQYVNDRPYAASSLPSVAISRALGSALHGRCRERPELAAAALPLELAVPALRDGDGLAERLFAPLAVTACERLGVPADDTPRVSPLREQRRAAVLAELRAAGAHRVLDLGCGEGLLLAVLLRDPAFTEIVGVDTRAVPRPRVGAGARVRPL